MSIDYTGDLFFDQYLSLPLSLMYSGIVYYMQEGKPDLIAYEGNLMYPINDVNFKDQQFVVAFNIGEESLSDKIQSLIKNNASGAMSSIVSFIANIGIKVGVQHMH